MKTSQKLSSKQKKSTPVPMQVKPDRETLDRFWDLANLIEDQQKHWKSVYNEMTAIIFEELDSAGICPWCGEFIEECGNARKTE